MSRGEVSVVSADEAGAAGDGDGVAWSRGLQRAEVGEVGLECVVGLAGDVALQAADDFAFGLAFFGASGGVGLGARAVAQATDGDHVQGAVGVAGAAVVEAVVGGASGGWWGRGWAGEGGVSAAVLVGVDYLAGG